MSTVKTCHKCLSFYKGRENLVLHESGLFQISLCGKCWKKYNKEKNA